MVVDTHDRDRTAWNGRGGRPTNRRGCKSASWRVTDAHGLPRPDTVGAGNAWLVLTNKSPVFAGMFRCGLVSLSFGAKSMEEVLGQEGAAL